MNKPEENGSDDKDNTVIDEAAKPDDVTTPDSQSNPLVNSSRGRVRVEDRSVSRTDKILKFNDCLVEKNGPEDMKKMAE